MMRHVSSPAKHFMSMEAITSSTRCPPRRGVSHGSEAGTYGNLNRSRAGEFDPDGLWQPRSEARRSDARNAKTSSFRVRGGEPKLAWPGATGSGFCVEVHTKDDGRQNHSRRRVRLPGVGRGTHDAVRRGRPEAHGRGPEAGGCLDPASVQW